MDIQNLERQEPNVRDQLILLRLQMALISMQHANESANHKYLPNSVFDFNLATERLNEAWKLVNKYKLRLKHEQEIQSLMDKYG